MGMPTQPVLDIMRRTMTNLRFVETHSAPDGPYEVTQLINSFIGALAHPWEAMREDLNTLPLTVAAERGWPRIVKERERDEEPVSVGRLLHLLRNAVAHGNIEFLSDGRGDIRALRVWNRDPRNGRRTWGAIVTVDDLRDLLLRFVQLIDERHPDDRWQMPSTA
jgi:hypothetical protein